MKDNQKYLKRFLAFVLSLAMIITFMPLSMMTAYAKTGDTPPHSKTLTDNHDGTYTIALDVVGESEKAPNNVNVVVIFDRSGSMVTQRMTAAKTAVNNLADKLYAYNTPSAPDTVEMALVSFATDASVTRTPTNNATQFKNAVNGMSANGGTNWEDALQKANGVDFEDEDQTFVIFVSDGNPTYRNTPDNDEDLPRYDNPNWSRNDWLNYRDDKRDDRDQYGLGSDNPNNTNYSPTSMTRCYNNAVDDAHVLVEKVGASNFFTIGAYGDVSRMQSLTTAAGAPAGNFYNANDTAALNQALEDILAKIEMMGISNVEIDDGTTNQVTTSSGEIAKLLEVDESSYKYYRSGGTYGTMQPWADAPAAELVNGAVEWDLSSKGVLENGVRYTVTFDCYPSQYTYDTIAQLKNHDITYASLDSEVKKYIVDNGNDNYSLRTNTNATLSWDDTRDDEGTQTDSYTNPDPVRTDADSLPIEKKWEGDEADVDKIDITVIADEGTAKEEKFHTATLTEDNKWKTSTFISVGIIKNGQALPGAKGHDFSFEELGAEQYHWEIDAPVVRPMRIGDDVVMLIKVDPKHPAPSGADTYTIDGATYYVDSAAVGLTATNYRRSNLNLTKVVTGNDAPEDTDFYFTMTLTSPEGTVEGLPFSVWEDGQFVTKACVVSGATEEIKDGVATGYYVGASGQPIVVKLKAGMNLRFTNVKSGTKYEFTEEEMDPGFTFVEAKLSGGTDTTFSGGRTSKGTVQEATKSYTVTYNNTYTPADEELHVTKKVTGHDAVEKFEFSLAAADEVTSAAIEAGDVVLPDAAKSAETSADIKDGASEKVTFGKITFNKAGKYKFKVDETTTTTKAGWTYDTSTHDITVDVEPDSTGVLKATVTGDNPTFTNSYVAAPVDAQIPVVKNVTPKDSGVADITGKFTFTLAAGDNTAGEGVETPMPASNTLLCGPDGVAVKFPAVTYSAAGEYTYTVTESVTPGKDAGGITLETEDPKTITVVVTDDGSGELKAVVNGGAILEFNNPYSVDAINITIPVTKILEVPEGWTGPEDITGEFTFTLTAKGNAPLPKTTSYENPEPNGGTVTFGADKDDPITIEGPGTYVYEVTETGSVKGVKNDAEATKTVTVKVTDNHDGTLSYTINDGEPVTFTNKYETKPVEASIPVEKILTGDKNAPDITGEYTFTLAAGDNTAGEGVKTPMPETTSYKNPDADGGSVTFGKIKYEKPGTYTYTVTEEGEVEGVINDQYDSREVTVSVTDDGEGNLVAKVSTDDNPVKFTNVYREASIVIPAIKNLIVPPGLTGPETIKGEYTFTITAEGNAPLPKTKSHTNPADNGGTVYFGGEDDPITFKTPGTYVYHITERGNVPGVKNDPKLTKDVTVEVSYQPVEVKKVKVIEKEVAVTKEKSSDDKAEASDESVVEAGSEAADETAVEAAVEASDEAAAEAADETSDETAAETAEAVDEAAEEVKAEAPAKAADNDTSKAADSEQETEIVRETVEETVTEQVLVAKIIDGENITFDNTYGVEPTTVTIPAKKELSAPADAKKPDITGKYTFTLAAKEGAPMPKTTSYPNPDKDGGSVTFGGKDDPITFTAPGTYTYTVSESGKVPGVTNDSEAAGKTITVSVTDNGDGTLKAVPSVTAENPVLFKNSYNYNETSVKLAVRKELVVPDELDGPGDITGKYTFDLYDTTTSAAGTKIDSVKNPASDGGTTDFPKEIKYTKPGTYTYKVTETGEVKGVKNDADAAKGKTVTVTVKDNGEGKLEPTIDYGNDAGHVIFTNVYEAPPVELPTTEIFSKTLKSMKPGVASAEFEFSIKPGDGAPDAEKEKATVKFIAAPAKEKIDFGKIEFNKPGTYTYTLTENTDKIDKGYKVTGNPGTVTVVVEDNGEGELVVTEKKDCTITNEFETVTVKGIKDWKDTKYYEDGKPLGHYKRPESITVNLLADGTKVDSQEVKVAEDGTWSYEFNNLPKYDREKDKDIVYTVTEESVAGYQSNVDGTTIINTPVEDKEVKPTNLTLKKIDAVTKNPIGTGAEFTLTKPDGTTATITTGNEGTATVEFTVAGEYKLAETKAPEGYSEESLPSYTITVTEKLNDIVLKVKENGTSVWSWIYDLIKNVTPDYDAVSNTLTVENPPLKTDITVNKVWNDANDQEKIRPESIQVQLLANGSAYGDPVTLDASNQWSHKWPGLDTYKDGEPITYTVDEVKVPEGYSSVTGDLTPVKDGDKVIGYKIDIVNTHEIPPVKDVFKPNDTTVSINKQEVRPNDMLTYGITYTNTTGHDETITITDKLPEYVTYDSATDGGTPNEDETVVTWTNIAVPNNTSKTVYVTVTVNEDAFGVKIINTATVKTSDHEYTVGPTENPTPKVLVIEKDLSNFVDHGNAVTANFAFRITGKSALRGDYNNVVAMEFKGHDVRKITLTNIPSDIEELKVEEIVSGNYTSSSEGVKPDGDGKYKVRFTNTYHDTDYETGTINNYKRVENEDGTISYSADGQGDHTSEPINSSSGTEEPQPNGSGQ